MVLLVRPESVSGDNSKDAAAISALGFTAVIDPFLKVHTSEDDSAALKVLRELPNAQWLVFTSARAVASWVELAGHENIAAQLAKSGQLRVAFVGQNTRAQFQAHFDSIVADSRIFAGAGFTSQSLAQTVIEQTALAGEIPGLVLFPQSRIALGVIDKELGKAGFTVENAVVYETRQLQKPASAAALEAGEFAVVVLRSPSAVAAVSSQVGRINAKIVTTAGATFDAAKTANLDVAAVAENPTPEAIAQAVLKAVKQ